MRYAVFEACVRKQNIGALLAKCDLVRCLTLLRCIAFITNGSQ